MTEKPDGNGNDLPDWDELKGVWQDTPPLDMAKLARSARFVWWRMRVNFVLEVVMSAVGLALFGSFIDFSSLPASIMGILGALYCAVAFWAAIHIRRGAWHMPDGDAHSLVDLQIRRVKSLLLYIKLNSWLGLAGGLMIPLAYWVLYDQFGTFDHVRIQRVHWVFGGLFVFVVGFPLAMIPVVRRKKRELQSLQDIQAQLQED